MARLRDTRTVPPGGWRYTQAETGCRLLGESIDELAEAMKRHRTYKDLDRATLAECYEDIHNQLCLGLGPDFCADVTEHVRDQSRSLTLSKIVGFTSGLIDFLKGGGALVDRETAETRAKICRGCPFNQTARACACAPFYAALALLIPKNRQIDGLEICGACGCALRVKVLMPDSVIHESNDGRDIHFPHWCWQRKVADEA